MTALYPHGGGNEWVVELYGVKLLGVNAHTGEELLFSLVLIAGILLLRLVLHALARLVVQASGSRRPRFWTQQAINMLSTVILLIGLVSIWFKDPARLATVGGLIGAGIAFALQKLIIAIAGYFVILRGKTFNLGDRIVMGNVRGDVIALDFIQTTILEMGQPPSVSDQTDPAIWVMGRQFTGRIVTVSNGMIFDQPVYNYSRDFKFLFEEVPIWIRYGDKHEVAEQILLDVARNETMNVRQLSEPALQHLKRVFDLDPPDVEPRVYYRMTSNWIELSLRFLCGDHGIRQMKDRMYREILRRLAAENIEIASGTYDIVGLPPVKVELEPPVAAEGSSSKPTR
jgi:small-conductance mechanosensitive channel